MERPALQSLRNEEQQQNNIIALVVKTTPTNYDDHVAEISE